MLTNLDIQPNAAINCWIATILPFDFKIVHVPADKHHRPDDLSQWPPLEGEDEEEEDPEDWVDEMLGLGIWVASWMAEATQWTSAVVAVLGMVTRVMVARQKAQMEDGEDIGTTEEAEKQAQKQKRTTTMGQKGDKDSIKYHSPNSDSQHEGPEKEGTGDKVGFGRMGGESQWMTKEKKEGDREDDKWITDEKMRGLEQELDEIWAYLMTGEQPHSLERATWR